MYVPDDFAEYDQDKIMALTRQYPFAMLVTTDQGEPYVTHLPLTYEPTNDENGKGKVIGHMARSNPQWQHLAEGQRALVVFEGPHAYISPTWYQSPGVPTWNYAVVHLRGQANLIEDADRLNAMLDDLITTHEPTLPQPWQENVPADKQDMLLKMIVGFEIEVTDISAKFKLNQNRSAADRANVITTLAASDNSLDNGIAELMKSL
ncbi:FMN-binding negative transcriptional regulator [Hydrogenovibrio kuenenii]|uniref:FMN-binding negative transcriptional regulator n=1 Tax=Hydrogenovibrio kuenenii TaxID=63658 RepID=UPI0004667C32|nr:FMN-binding negative transcriptional regulator [Hydrogenovibrio kuenenii]